MAIGLFAASAVVIAFAGVHMTRLADMIADRTGLGEAVIGGVLLGASTSLSGTVTSVSAAANGLASLAVSNAIGGICAQTVFLVVADLSYRKVNLEHAAADEKNMLQESAKAWREADAFSFTVSSSLAITPGRNAKSGSSRDWRHPANRPLPQGWSRKASSRASRA